MAEIVITTRQVTNLSDFSTKTNKAISDVSCKQEIKRIGVTAYETQSAR